jgi:hypothetical protein
VRWLLPASAHLRVLGWHPGLHLHALAGDRAWASRGYQLLTADLTDEALAWRPIGEVPQTLWRALAGHSSWLAAGLRLGVHGLLPLPSGALLVSVSGAILRSDDGRQWTPVLRHPGMRKPARHGLTLDGSGRVWIAQYALNHDRSQPMHVWRSEDDGRTFRIAERFAAGVVRHIHFVQEDPHDGRLWLGTGDRDAECRLQASGDGGRTWRVEGSGRQDFRAVGLAFTADGVYWGTDAGIDAEDYPNRLLRRRRDDGAVEELSRVPGPVHGITALANGGLLASTGVEGGRNEADQHVHLWHSRDGRRWREVWRVRRGLQPRRAQYAVAHFAAGQATTARTFVVLKGTAAAQLATVEIALD